MSNIPPSSGRAYSFLFVAIFAWGLSVPFIEFGLVFIRPLPYLFYRFTLATLLLTPFVILFRKHEFVDLMRNKWTWIIGGSESFGLISQYLGQQQGVPGGLAALLSLCFLLIVPFLSPIILGEKLKNFHILSILIGFVGIIFISTEGDIANLTGGRVSVLGVVLLLGAAFGYAFYLVSTSRLTTIEKTDVDTFTLFYAVLLIISFFSGLATLSFSNFEPVHEKVWLWLILLTIFSTLIAFFSYFEALKTISANTSSVLLLLQVLVPFAIDFIFLERRYGIWIMSGAILILFSMIIVVGVPYYMMKTNNS